MRQRGGLVAKIDGLGDLDAQFGGDLSDGRRPFERGLQVVTRGVVHLDPGAETLGQEVLVPKLVDDGALDPPRRVRGELKAGRGVPALNGVDQSEGPEGTELLHPVRRARATGEALGHNGDQRRIEEDQVVPVLPRAVLPVLGPQSVCSASKVARAAV